MVGIRFLSATTPNRTDAQTVDVPRIWKTIRTALIDERRLMLPKRTPLKPRSLYDDDSSDEDEGSRGPPRPGVSSSFSSLLLGANIITGAQRAGAGAGAEAGSALKRPRESEGEDSDDMLTQTAKSQRANKERRHLEAKQARDRQDRQDRLQTPRLAPFPASNSSSSSSINSGSGSSSSTRTHEGSAARNPAAPTPSAPAPPPPVPSKRISYAEMQALARQERMDELASFTALSQAPAARAGAGMSPTGSQGWDDADDDEDEWMDRAEVVGRAEPADAAQRQEAQAQAHAKRMQPAQRHPSSSSSAAGSAARAGREIMAAGGKRRAADAAAASPPDAQDDADDGPEHPSCDLKGSCRRRGPLLLAALDAAAEPKQKGIVRTGSTIEAVPASEVNQACASRLLPHQVIGVQWLWRKYALGQGAILGDGTDVCVYCSVV